MAHLIGFVGGLGAGKTTGASIFPWIWKNAVEAAGGDLQLYANYDLTGAKQMNVPSDWYEVAEDHGSICIWDESHRTFDSRKFNNFQNIFATELLTFVRKLASIQVFATPSIQRLDSRIRDMLEILVVCRPTGNGTYYDFYDYQADFGGRYGRYLHSKFLPRWKMKQIHKLNLFDSMSFVNKFPLPNNEKSAEKFMVELEAAHWRGVNKRRGRKEVEVNNEQIEPSRPIKISKRSTKIGVSVS